MVTAGVFMIARCSPLFEYSPTALIVITFAGAMTSFLAATTGILQNDLKRVIAYSTCSQLGYMIFACGISNYSVRVVFPRNRYRCSYDVVNTHWNHGIPSTIVRSNGSTPCFDAQRKKSEEGKHAQRRKAQGLAEIPEPLRALSTKQDIQVSSDPYGKSSLGID